MVRKQIQLFIQPQGDTYSGGKITLFGPYDDGFGNTGPVYNDGEVNGAYLDFIVDTEPLKIHIRGHLGEISKKLETQIYSNSMITTLSTDFILVSFAFNKDLSAFPSFVDGSKSWVDVLTDCVWDESHGFKKYGSYPYNTKPGLFNDGNWDVGSVFIGKLRPLVPNGLENEANCEIDINAAIFKDSYNVQNSRAFHGWYLEGYTDQSSFKFKYDKRPVTPTLSWSTDLVGSLSQDKQFTIEMNRKVIAGELRNRQFGFYDLSNYNQFDQTWKVIEEGKKWTVNYVPINQGASIINIIGDYSASDDRDSKGQKSAEPIAYINTTTGDPKFRQVTSISGTGGYGYTSDPTVTLVGGQLIQKNPIAKAKINVTAGVTEFTIINAGSGYSRSFDVDITRAPGET